MNDKITAVERTQGAEQFTVPTANFDRLDLYKELGTTSSRNGDALRPSPHDHGQLVFSNVFDEQSKDHDIDYFMDPRLSLKSQGENSSKPADLAQDLRQDLGSAFVDLWQFNLDQYFNPGNLAADAKALSRDFENLASDYNALIAGGGGAGGDTGAANQPGDGGCGGHYGGGGNPGDGGGGGGGMGPGVPPGDGGGGGGMGPGVPPGDGGGGGGANGENAQLDKLIHTHSGVTAQDVSDIQRDLHNLPEAQKQELLRDHIDIELYQDGSQDPNGVSGAAAYTDGSTIVDYTDTGIKDEALAHEAFHTFDLNGADVTSNPQYQQALQDDLNNLTPQQFQQLSRILADPPYVNSKFGSVPIGDIAAEQFAGLAGQDESGFASAMVNWLPNSAKILGGLTGTANTMLA